MFRRETIIALRARHQAYRIASDILNPHAEVPAPPQPVMPIDPPDLRAYRSVVRKATVIVAATVWGLVAVYWVIQWLTRWH